MKMDECYMGMRLSHDYLSWYLSWLLIENTIGKQLCVVGTYAVW